MNIKYEIEDLLKKEDKHNPLTDQQIAEILNNSTRENITFFRKKNNIKDSRERKKCSMINDVDKFISKNKDFSISSITNYLNSIGYHTSRNVVSKLVKDENNKSNHDQNISLKMDSFKQLIGFNESLKTSIMQAKAAILYPPFGLATLIIGESGVGKSNFAKCMYEFALQNNRINKEKAFIVFNCADYSDNPQLLLSILFGYKKGAFTGADKDTIGLVEKANEGILFLDEIHRLPPKGQEILFSILDNGKFRRMGETEFERKTRVLIICATTENIESSLLISFRRRIPMLINLPSYRDRKDNEKIELVKYFFQNECNRINKKLFIEADIIKILLNCNFPGNIGQLKSKIQVLCAKAFMKFINKQNEMLTVGINDIDSYLVNDTYKRQKSINDYIFVPFKDNQNNKCKFHESNSLEKNIYSKMIKKYNELQVKMTDQEKIYDELSKMIIKEFNKLDFNNGRGDDLELYNLKSIVNDEVIDCILKIENDIKNSYKNKKLNRNAFSYLAIHIQETLTRLANKENILNFNANEIIKKYSNEYIIAKKLSSYLKSVTNISIPETEIGFITLYIKMIVENKFLKKVAIIVISHGGIASEVVKVVNKFISGSSITPIDMPLDEDPSNFYKVTLDVAKKVDEGKGILFLVDMGSLVYFGNHVHEDTGIETKTIDRVDLLTVIEAARKSCISSNNLYDIYYSLIKNRTRSPLLTIKNNNKKMVIIAICITGQGTARRIKKALSKIYNGIEIITLGITDKNFECKVKKMIDKYNVIAITGTINPEIEGVNFVPFNERLLLNVKDKFDVILSSNNEMDNIIRKSNVIILSDVKEKRNALDVMLSKLINDGSVKKEFINSVYERENDVPTFLKNSIAIPHGHPDYVNRPSIVIAKLNNPINWGIGKVRIICLLALKYSNKDLFSKLIKLFSCSKLYQKIIDLNSEEDLYNLIVDNLNKEEI